jgi:hypothetical protein
MGCHDGLTAVDSHGPTVGTAAGAPPTGGGTAMTSSGRYINDLTVTHPIGFLYSDAYAVRGATELMPASSQFIDRVPNAATADTHTRAGWTTLTTKISDVLYNGYVTCASCHEVHNTKNSENDPQIRGPFKPNYFVRAREQNSALCLSCHIK